MSAAGDRVRCRPAPRLATTTLRHLLLDQVLPLAVSRHGKLVQLVLHASAVHVPRIGAIAFAGPTGCGKSTVAAALGLRGCPTITDDCLIIAGARGRRSILPGYPGVRLWRTTARALGLGGGDPVTHYSSKRRLDAELPFRRRPSPLRAIFALGRRVSPNRPACAIPLQSRDRLMALAPYTYLLDVGDRRQLAQTFSALSAIVTELPVQRLRLRDASRTPARTARFAGDFADEVLALIGRVAVDS